MFEGGGWVLFNSCRVREVLNYATCTHKNVTECKDCGCKTFKTNGPFIKLQKAL